MNNFSIEHLISVIEKGKVRGFDEVKEIDGECYLFQYALKKKNGLYNTYLFYIIEKRWKLLRIMVQKKLKNSQI